MHRRTALLALSALALAACSSSDAATPPPTTVGLVGTLPDATAPASTTTTSRARDVPSDPSDPSDPSAPTTDGGPTTTRPVGETIDGNRVLVLGDSVLASISSRYGDQLCTDLVWRGWQVEVDAEVGRPISFGRQVLAQRGSAGWDAAVVMLGNNYDGDAAAYAAELNALLDELGNIPVVLLTVTRYRPEQDQVNYVLHTTANERPNVRLVDWQERTAKDDSDTLLAGDGLHLSDDGRVLLAAMITSALGSPRDDATGECLPSSFTDDSMGTVTGGTTTTVRGSSSGSGNSNGSSSGGSGSGGSRSRVTTTTRPRRSGGGTGSGSSSGGGVVHTTPTTAAPPVDPTPQPTQPASGGGGGGGGSGTTGP